MDALPWEESQLRKWLRAFRREGLQICSDVTGLPQEVPEKIVGAAYGDAYLAGYAAGLFTDSRPLKQQWVKIVRTVEPHRQLMSVYDEMYDIYHRLYRNTREEMHQLSARHKG